MSVQKISYDHSVKLRTQAAAFSAQKPFLLNNFIYFLKKYEIASDFVK